MKIQDKQFLNIKKLYPKAEFVFKPLTPGGIHDVYIIEISNNKYVCRFSSKNVAQHNLKVSKLLLSENINVPKVSVYNFGDVWCETYPFVYGKTLHERLIEGISKEKLNNIYRQLFEISQKISNLPYNDIPTIPMSIVSKGIRKTFDLFYPSDKKLCHSDLHAKNVILNEKDDISAIIDLDSVLPGNLLFAHFKIANNALFYGYDIHKFETFCNDVDIKRLENQIKVHKITSGLYNFMFPEFIRKQLLKIRVK